MPTTSSSRNQPGSVVTDGAPGGLPAAAGTKRRVGHGSDPSRGAGRARRPGGPAAADRRESRGEAGEDRGGAEAVAEEGGAPAEAAR